jgi:hypothetical protein
MEMGCAIPGNADTVLHVGLSGYPNAFEPVIVPAIMRQAFLGLIVQEGLAVRADAGELQLVAHNAEFGFFLQYPFK